MFVVACAFCVIVPSIIEPGGFWFFWLVATVSGAEDYSITVVVVAVLQLFVQVVVWAEF